MLTFFTKLEEEINKKPKTVFFFITFMVLSFLGTFFWTGSFVNAIFVLVLFILLAYDLLLHTYSKAWYPTIGMFGTFLGIFLGLMDFDTVNIENSLPVLLDGLKIAFLTSIAGLVFSIIRILLAKFGLCPIDEKTELAELENMNSNFDKFIKK